MNDPKPLTPTELLGVLHRGERFNVPGAEYNPFRMKDGVLLDCDDDDRGLSWIIDNDDESALRSDCTLYVEPPKQEIWEALPVFDDSSATLTQRSAPETAYVARGPVSVVLCERFDLPRWSARYPSLTLLRRGTLTRGFIASTGARLTRSMR